MDLIDLVNSLLTIEYILAYDFCLFVSQGNSTVGCLCAFLTLKAWSMCYTLESNMNTLL